MDHIII